MEKRYIIISAIIILGVIIYGFKENILYNLSKELNSISSGSFTYAEKFQLDFPQSKVKLAIKEFKRTHPEYNVPKITINQKPAGELKDNQSENPNFWYYTYFYYPEKNKIVYTYTRGNEIKTTFALIAVNEGLDIGNWKQINGDYSFEENNKEIEEFKNRILNEIKLILERN